MRGSVARMRIEVEIADHGGQQIVEIMGEAAGELADRLHLLGLHQRGFGPLAMLDLALQFEICRFELGRALLYALLRASH